MMTLCKYEERHKYYKEICILFQIYLNNFFRFLGMKKKSFTFNKHSVIDQQTRITYFTEIIQGIYENL